MPAEPTTVSPALSTEELLTGLCRLRVDKNSRIPIYIQISEGIRKVLVTRQVPAGSQLPSSFELCQQFAVSRVTLRQAFDLLERDGLIETRRGKGTFVACPRVQKTLTDMRGFGEEMRLRGKVPSTRMLLFQESRPGLAARDLLRLEEHQPVYEIRRLRLADGVPLAIEDVQLPSALVPRLDRANLSERSLYGVLEEEYGIRLVRCEDEVSAVLPNREQKRILGLDHPVALLQIKRVSYTKDDLPVELAVTVYRGDVYAATIRAVRAASDSDAAR